MLVQEWLGWINIDASTGVVGLDQHRWRDANFLYGTLCVLFTIVIGCASRGTYRPAESKHVRETAKQWHNKNKGVCCRGYGTGTYHVGYVAETFLIFFLSCASWQDRGSP
jgi:hypothetical protein